MRFAFWRRDKPAAEDAPPSRFGADDGKAVDPAQTLRIRTRRRLIGAAALLLAVAIVVPMLLDPVPRAVPDTIPIEIPGDKTPFTPRLAPPAGEPVSGPAAPPPDAATARARGASDPRADATADKPKADAAADKARTDGAARTPVARAEAVDKSARGDAGRDAGDAAGADKTARTDASDKPVADKADEARRAEDILAGKVDPAGRPDPRMAKGGKFVVQAAASASEATARQLADKLKKGGFAAFTEKVETKDGTRYRVRLGPYATRDDAEQVRARLKGAGVAGNTVAL